MPSGKLSMTRSRRRQFSGSIVRHVVRADASAAFVRYSGSR
ncbi:hypothetical protein BIFDEN_01772 [Bifidobacterium dentium ATCC 27678]|nr:hypothetical protein BIFDEN_01772 [Bifidobacterium dentium ATCC 27678]